MKTNKYFRYFILILIMFGIFSCNEDEYLQSDYYENVVDVNFLTIPSHADKAVIGMYDVLGYLGLYKWGRNALGSSTADCIGEDHNDAGWSTLIDLDKYRFDPNNDFIWEHWSHNYTGILMANTIVEKVEGIPGIDETLAKRYAAEAKALRALFYYNLVTAHGDVPLYTTSLTLKEVKELTRTPAAYVWAQIIKDLTEAEQDLPDTYTSAEDAARVTRGFANAMLSTVYLWTKDYSKAADAALEVINSPAGYDLEPHFADLFNGVSEMSSERIFALSCVSDIPTSNIWMHLGMEYNRAPLTGPTVNWSGYMQPSRDFINTLDPNDVRTDTMIFDPESGEVYDRNADGIIDATDDPTLKGGSNAYNMKYIPWGGNLTAAGSTWGNGQLSWVDVHIIRYAEVLLNYAEALVELDQAPAALPYLNQIRTRASLGDITTTDKTQLRDIILNERKMEFVGEGKRFFDLKRVGRLDEFLGPLGFIPNKQENFPIPLQELDLTNMEDPDYQ